MQDKITVPMDVYDSPQEMCIVLPLWWVEKSSVQLQLAWLRLKISGERKQPAIKDSLQAMQENCFRWIFEKVVDIPANTAFDRIWSELSPENILMIVVPKVISPEEIVVNIR